MPIQIGQRPDHDFNEPLGLLSDCHRRVKHFLAVLVTVAGENDGGALTPAQRKALGASLTYFENAAPKHTADEEVSLFPRLRATGDPAAARALELIDRLEHDHTEAEGHHTRANALVRQWLEHDRLATADAAELRVHLDRLQAIYKAHIAVEDEELFPAAQRLLDAIQLREIGREMAARRQVTRTPFDNQAIGAPGDDR